MRKLLGSLTVALMLAIPVGAQAQVSVGPIAAFHDDADLGIGAVVGVPLEQVTEGFAILGDFTYYFPDGFDYWEINGNATWDIPVEDAPVTPFLLGGLNYANFSFDFDFGPIVTDDSASEIGLNIGGGVRFQAGGLEPIAGLKFEASGGEGIVIFGALPFQVGG